MDRQAGGLVYHQDVLVLIDHINRTGGGRHIQPGAGIGHQRREYLTVRCPLAGDGADAVQQNAVFQLLDPADHGAGQVQVPAQQRVDLLAGLRRRDRQRQAAGGLGFHKSLLFHFFSSIA